MWGLGLTREHLGVHGVEVGVGVASRDPGMGRDMGMDVDIAVSKDKRRVKRRGRMTR